MRPFSTNLFSKSSLSCAAFLRRLAFTLLLLANAFVGANAQQANNWYFGTSAGVNFGAPTALTGGVMNAWEGSATISDQLGNLLFYTDGVTVWNRNHAVMTNGTGLLGNIGATQSAIIVPNPTSTSKYWVFTVDKEGGANGLRYSEVDMTLSAGLGAVTASKNILLYTPVSEKLTAVKKCDGRGYYILSHKWNSAEFLLYETTIGVPTPTFVSAQNIGMSHTGAVVNAMGYMKASPSGKKIASAMNQTGMVELYDFNTSTGVLSNLKTINTGKWNYGVEFSPNMKYLYISTWYDNGGNRTIMQYDISVAVPNSVYNYNSARTLGALQLGPDGKIYYTNGDYNGATGQMNLNNSNLGVIASPNLNGGGSFNDNAVSLAGRKCNHGLPNFVSSLLIDNTKDFTSANFCYGSNTDFTSTLPTDADSVRFFFGDGFESYVRNPSHLYPAAGTYSVKMKIFKGCVADSVTKNVTIILCASSACNSGTGCFSPNLITNSGFEGGNTGFTSAFTANNGSATCTPGANSCGQYLCGNGYALATSPTPCNPTWSNSIRDHTSGAGNMMLVDFPNSGQNNIWCQTVTLAASTDYCFGAYYINLLPSGTGQPTPTFIYTVAGASVGNSATIPENEQWNFTGINFNSAAGGAVQLCIKNQNAGGVGYDVAIDDIILRSSFPGSPPAPVQDVISLCGTGTSGTINVVANDAPGSTPLNNSSLRIIQQAPFTQGTAVANSAAGTITFTPSAGFSGPVAVQYQICNTGGCCANGTVLIDQAPNSTPSVSIFSNPFFPICPGTSVTFNANPTNGGTAPTYQWKVAGVNVGTGSSFTTTTLTNNQLVEVIMTSNAQCVSPATASANVTAQVNSLATPVVTVVPGVTLCSDAGGVQVDLTVPTVAGITYDWTGGSQGTLFQDMPTTTSTYCVTATNAAGCTAETCKTITVNQFPTPTITGTTAFCAGAGGVTLTASSGSTYLWNSGSSLNTAVNAVNPAATTTYTVSVTANGCTSTTSQVVTVNGITLVPMVPPAPLCPNVGTVTIGYNDNSNTYAWSLPGAFTGLLTLSPLVTTTYTVTVTTPSGCTSVQSVLVAVNAISAPTITGNTTICAGGSTTLTSSAANTYAWSSTPASSAAAITVSPAVTTTYTVTITSTTLCTATKSVTVTVTPSATATITGPTSVCTGSPLALTASGGTTYLWSNTSATTTAAFNIPSMTTTATYTVTVTAGVNCSSTKSITVTVNALPTATIAGTPSVCTGLSTTLTASGGTSYVWSVPATTTAAVTVSPSTATIYTVTATDINNCTDTESVTVTISPLPTISITGPSTVCAGSAITLTAFSPTAGSSYNWAGAATAPYTFTPIATNTYTVTVTTPAGCVGTAAQSVTYVPLPMPTILPANPSFCAGTGGVNLTANNGSSYVWSNGTPAATTNVTIANTYTVTATANGCSSSTSVTVTQNSLLLTAMSPISICAGQSATLGNPAVLGLTYNWSNTLGTTAQPVVTPLGTTTYTVTATDANGCTAIGTQQVTVNALPVVPAIVGPISVCVGTNVTLTASGGGTYNWDNGLTTNSIAVTPSIPSSTYTVAVTNAFMCTTIRSITVIVNALPVAVIPPVAAVCSGLSTTMAATGGVSYVWNTNQVGSPITISPTTNTTYTVTATDANGCTDSETVAVVVNSLNVPNIAPATTCANAPVTIGYQPGSFPANDPTITYNWVSSLGSGSTITVMPAVGASYTVTVTDANGCNAVKTVAVTVNNSLSVNIQTPPAVCDGKSITLIANSAPGATYDWGGTVFPITPVLGGNNVYSVTATGTTGCTGSSSVTVVVNPLPIAGITPLNPAVCINKNIALTGTGGSAYAWSPSGGTASINVSPTAAANTYTVTVTDANSCTAISTTTVTINQLSPPATAPVAPICRGTTTPNIGPSDGTLTYDWGSALGTTAQIQVSPTVTTSYTVTATDVNTCTTTVSVTVTLHPDAVATASVLPLTICSGGSATLTGGGGLTYVWSSPAGATTISPTTTTAYTVTATDINGCTDTETVTLNVNPLPIVSITGATSVCSLTPTLLTASVLSGTANFNWGSVATAANTVIPDFNNNPNTYTVTATDANGCSGTKVHTITAIQSFGTSATLAHDQTSTVICAGTNVTFTATGATGAPGATLSYEWFINGVSIGAPSGNATFPWTAALNPPTNITGISVKISNSSACSTANLTAPISFTVIPTVVPAVSIAASATTICVGTPVTFTATPTNGGVTPVYVWKLNGVVDAAFTGTTFTPAALANGDQIQVELTSNAPCPTPATVVSNTITMTVNPVLPFSFGVTPNVNTICAGDNVIFTANMPTDGSAGSSPQFQWTITNALGVVTNVGSNQNTYQSTTIQTGDIVGCTVTPNAACNSTPLTANATPIIVNPTGVTPSVTVISSGPACPGSPVTFTATPANGGPSPTYKWYENNVLIAGAVADIYTSVSLANNDVVRVEMIPNAACVSNSAVDASIPVVILPPVTSLVSIRSSSTSVCAGTTIDFNAIITRPGGAGSTYQWQVSAPNSTIFTNTGTNSSMYSTSTLISGQRVRCIYTSDAQCAVNPQSSAYIQVIIDPLVTVGPFNVTTSVATVCTGAFTSFYATPTTGAGNNPTYEWQVNGVSVPDLSGSQFTTNQLQPGDVVDVIMTSSERCALTPTVTQNVPFTIQALAVNITPDALDTCKLGKGKVTALAGGILPTTSMFYTWSDANATFNTTGILTNVFSTQIYTVTATDNFGCTATATLNLPTTGNITIDGLTTTPQLCIDPTTSGTATITHNMNNPPFSYSWADINGAIVGSTANLMAGAGTYTVEVTDISGCTDTKVAIIQPPLYPSVTVRPALTTIVLGDSLTLITVPGAQEAYVYSWSAVAGLNCYDCKKPVARPVVSSVYTVTITNAAGCSASASAQIDIDKKYNVYIPNIITPNNDGANDFFVVYANSSVNIIKKISIFDRWGELVFSNQNMPANTAENSWDGTFKGRELNNAVFVYILEVEYVDGTTETFKGDITVVK
jgi:gliding motility-associated-like protein